MAWWQKFDLPAAAWLRRVWTYGLVGGSPKRASQPHYSREVVSAMRRGGEVRELTVLVSDVRGFTTLSEKLEPAQIAETLNATLTEITAIVNRHGGVIDRFIGDGMMVLYNAPLETRDHALQAVQTALELEERTRDISRRWEAQLGVVIRWGVGISTGRAFVGNIGSTQRMQYGAVGYTVDLASRLEGLTREYNVPIVISETTHRHLAGRIPTRELGEVIPKDMTRPVKIFTVLTSAGNGDV